MGRILALGRIVICALALGLTSCATTSRHQFAQPAVDWQTKSGQLLYKGAKTKLIGEVLVRFSKKGDLELTFTKGPGITLLTVHQDDSFARVSGPLARGSWSGPPAKAPTRLRGWLELREELRRAGNQPMLRHVSGNETFLFRF